MKNFSANRIFVTFCSILALALIPEISIGQNMGMESLLNDTIKQNKNLSLAADSLSQKKIGGNISINLDSVKSNLDKTLYTNLKVQKYFVPSPTKALVFSALLPGLGQIYNRKYWKVPIIYAGFAGFSYAISWNQRYYKDYFAAYYDLLNGRDSWKKFIPPTIDPDRLNKKWLEGVFKRRKDYFRRYRDLSIILTSAFYILNIIDAYVDASLYDFDVSPDIAFMVTPAFISNQISGDTAMGASFGIRFNMINFL